MESIPQPPSQVKTTVLYPADLEQFVKDEDINMSRLFRIVLRGLKANSTVTVTMDDARR